MQAPGNAPIFGMQYDAAVADRPALVGVGERNGFKIDGGGDILCLPQGTTIGRVQNCATFARDPTGIGINEKNRGQIRCGLAVLPVPDALSPSLGHTCPTDQQSKENHRENPMVWVHVHQFSRVWFAHPCDCRLFFVLAQLVKAPGIERVICAW